ncbi:winged helix-turn-helix transcriptional regulator [Infirmifilum lucidum]|uniref:Winged helix-turn-helix transcriptional regulator n=1 Tax=Infirmifilum lucidum TaxID=2776706 RepID=A0A7L9FI54_9CREN|nr:winged helix-turn-helix transcriptional regulator [Infirmifilum lucidum]QOJ78604.1 winged helix-turn-helix transcriptional regulator [Infirmifilum lucidum]
MLDELDIRILEVLLHDPRAPISHISKETGLSRPTVRARLKKLLESGIVKGFRIELDEEKMGSRTFLLTLSVKNADEAIKEILGFGGVYEVYVSPGQQNLLVFLHASDIDFLANILDFAKKLDPLAELRLVTSIIRVDRSIERIIASGKATIHCETCGTLIRGTPFTYTHGNRKHYFCCPVCKQAFVDKVRKSGHQ